MTEHLGYEKHGSAGAGADNISTGTRAKTVLTDTDVILVGVRVHSSA